MRVMELRDGWGTEHIVAGGRPVPEAGPGEAVLRMRAGTLNYRDWLLVRGGYGGRGGTLPLIPVSDGVGEVIAVGAGVTRVKPGDRACPCFFPAWLSGPPGPEGFARALGGTVPGVMQEYMAVPADCLVVVPAHLEDTEAAALPCAGVTAWSAVIHQGETRPGDVVLTQGSGGVSVFAILLARMAGARVIATTSSPDKAARLKALGADEVIDTGATPEWGRRAKALTGGRGVDHVVEVGGAGTLKESLRAVRPGGRVSLIGVLGGATGELNLGVAVMMNVRLQGVTVGSRDMLADLARAIHQSDMRVPVDPHVWRFDELRPALESLAGGRHFGKIALRF